MDYIFQPYGPKELVDETIEWEDWYLCEYDD